MSLHVLCPSIEWRDVVHLIKSHLSFRTQLTYHILQEVFFWAFLPHCPVKGRNPSPSPVFLMYLVHTTLWITALWHFHFIFCVCLPNYYEFFEARRMSYLLLCLQGLAQYLTQSKRERKEAKTYWETALEEKWVETGGNLSLLTSQHFQEEGSDTPI